MSRPPRCAHVYAVRVLPVTHAKPSPCTFACARGAHTLSNICVESRQVGSRGWADRYAFALLLLTHMLSHDSSTSPLLTPALSQYVAPSPHAGLLAGAVPPATSAAHSQAAAHMTSSR